MLSNENLMSEAESSTAGMRRVPRQMRGQQRVESILEAAAQIFAEAGYEAATTNAIAARAGIPIGSVYQFFPNKTALLHALALRYLDGLRQLYAENLSEQAAQEPVETTLGRFVDAFIAFQQQNVGFGAVFGGAPLSDEVASATADLMHELIARVDVLLQAYAPELSATQRPLHTTIMVYLVKGLMPLLAQADRAMHAAAAAEFKIALLAYLETLRHRQAS